MEEICQFFSRQLAGRGRRALALFVPVAIGAVAPTALLVEAAGQALVGSKLEDEAIDGAVTAARAAASPISDKRASAQYRTHVVGVLVKRAIQRAQARINAGAKP